MELALSPDQDEEELPQALEDNEPPDAELEGAEDDDENLGGLDGDLALLKSGYTQHGKVLHLLDDLEDRALCGCQGDLTHIDYGLDEALAMLWLRLS